MKLHIFPIRKQKHKIVNVYDQFWPGQMEAERKSPALADFELHRCPIPTVPAL